MKMSARLVQTIVLLMELARTQMELFIVNVILVIKEMELIAQVRLIPYVSLHFRNGDFVAARQPDLSASFKLDGN